MLLLQRCSLPLILSIAHALEVQETMCSANVSSGLSFLQSSKRHIRVGQTLSTDTFFCWAIVGPWEQTFTEFRVQMQGCDGYSIFSNFSDPSRNIIKLFDDDMHVNLVRGYANVTMKFAAAWASVAQLTKTMNYDWYVKCDADTFFRPQFLPQLVAGLDASSAIGVGMNGKLQAPVEVVSNGALHSHTPFFEDPVSLIKSKACKRRGCWWEDVWINTAFATHGVKVHEAHMIDGCLALVYNSYRNHRSMPLCDEQIYYGDGHVVPTIFDNPIHCKTQRARSGAEGPHCVHHNVVAIHPVKKLKIFTQFQSLVSKSWKKQQPL